MDCDLLVVGGGINGAGIARDAAGRGLSVVLCEKDDLASHTSSASTKLVHGGLRYLEQYEFGLVRKALMEREILLRSAPHIIRPLRFVMPHDVGQRSVWMIRAGLFLYDVLARRELLPRSHGINLHRHEAGGPLQPVFERGFVYSDGWVDDARLVLLNAMDASEKGAVILTRTCCESLVRQGRQWQATLRNDHGQTLIVTARCVVNAAGPWAHHFLQTVADVASGNSLRLIKGSHIVVKQLFDHPYAYIFQNSDKRIVFAIPYEKAFTLIGTTDIEYRGDAGDVRISGEEVNYLCALANRYFLKKVVPADVIWSYAGVRPLVDDGASHASAVTRDYRLVLENDGPPLLSVFGGKITTFRKLAEDAVDMIASILLNKHGAWTAHACLPGGDVSGGLPSNRAVLGFGQYVRDKQKTYAWLAPSLIARYVEAYGTRIDTLLSGRTCPADMGEEIVPGLFAVEVDYLMQREWACNANDILWRRSKLGLHLPPQAAEVLDQWIKDRRTD